MHIKPPDLIKELEPQFPDFGPVELWVVAAALNRDSLTPAVVCEEMSRYIKFYSPPYSYGLVKSVAGLELIKATLKKIKGSPLMLVLGENRRALLEAKLNETLESLLLKSGTARVSAITDELLKIANSTDDPLLQARILKDAAELTLRLTTQKQNDRVVKQAESLTILTAIRNLNQDATTQEH